MRAVWALLALSVACSRSQRGSDPSPAAAQAKKAPAPSASTVTASPGVDLVSECERAVRNAESTDDLAAGCAGLYALPRCRAEYASTTDKASYIGRVVTACALDYCPVLREPVPEICRHVRARDAGKPEAELDPALAEGGFREFAQRWPELNRAILTHHFGKQAALRLEKAALRSRKVLEGRAFALVFTLCDAPAAEIRTPAGDRVGVGQRERKLLGILAKGSTGCAARRSAGTGDEKFRFLVATGDPHWTEKLAVELSYDAASDTFALIHVSPSDGRESGAHDGIVAYRTRTGLIAVSRPEPAGKP